MMPINTQINHEVFFQKTSLRLLSHPRVQYNNCAILLIRLIYGNLMYASRGVEVTVDHFDPQHKSLISEIISLYFLTIHSISYIFFHPYFSIQLYFLIAALTSYILL